MALGKDYEWEPIGNVTTLSSMMIATFKSNADVPPDSVPQGAHSQGHLLFRFSLFSLRLSTLSSSQLSILYAISSFRARCRYLDRW